MVNVKDLFRPDWLYNFFFYRKMQGLLGDGDALVLIPYSDNMMVPKRGYYEKHLVGNLPGYRTGDGDVFVAEGKGNPIKSLFGVPVVLGLDPSQHAGIIEPLKSLIAHKRSEGEFIRVNRQGQPVEAGEAVGLADGGQLQPATVGPTEVNFQAYEGLFDLTPPMIKDPETGDIVDQADGWIVDQSKAAELVPSKTSSGEIALMQQRERNAAMEKSEMIKYLLIGAVSASVLWLIFMVILAVATNGLPSVVG